MTPIDDTIDAPSYRQFGAMRQMRSFFLIVVFALAGSALLYAAEPAVPPTKPDLTATEGRPWRDQSWRRHFVLKTKRDEILYEATEVVSLSQARSESTLLLWDEGAAGGLKLHHVTDFETQEARYRLEETEGNAFLALSFPLGFTTRTLQETLKQGRENPLLFETIDSALTFATNSYRRTAPSNLSGVTRQISECGGLRSAHRWPERCWSKSSDSETVRSLRTLWPTMRSLY
jgi:hypothetical protein